MKFDIYGRFQLEVRREQAEWIAYRVGQGVRRREEGIAIPAQISESALESFLDDVYHEYAVPGRSIRRV